MTIEQWSQTGKGATAIMAKERDPYLGDLYSNGWRRRGGE